MLRIAPAVASKKVTSLHLLKETNVEVALHTAEENRYAAISLAENATYSIDIFTQKLDPLLYDNKEFESHIAVLARKHPNSRIRILVKDSNNAVRNSHRLIRLARNMTSSILIRKPSQIHQDEQCEFMVTDTIGILYRINTYQYNYDASVSSYSPQRASQLEAFFNDAWDNAEEDRKVHRLYV